MRLNIFSISGEALNFGVRRMETTSRLAWIPISLLLVFNMASVFLVLSATSGEVITFGDLAGRATFERAQQIASQRLLSGVASGAPVALIIFLASGLVNMILVSSFMAPLVAYAGSGERPGKGLFLFPFGPSQTRFLVASFLGGIILPVLIVLPLASLAYFTISFVETALAYTYVRFPDPDSLHTLELVPARDVLAERGSLWLYEFGYLFVAATGVMLATIALFSRHVRGGILGATLFVGSFVLVFCFFATNQFTKGPFNDATAVGILTGLLLLLLIYGGLRLLAYPGVAVNRKSLAFGPTFSVTRSGNLFRIFATCLLVFGVLFAVNLGVVKLILPAIATVVASLFQATSAYTQLVNGSEAGGWILPVFVWIWAGIKILYVFIWSFFYYGVLAGLLGRLYRESEFA